MTEPLRLALVGAGAISQSYYKTLQGSSVARWVAVADVREEAAKAAADTLKCDAYTRYEDVLDKGRCDAVVICTPPSTHREIAIHFLDRGIPVMCEKPLAIDAASARAICAASDRNGVVLAMASKFRYVDDIIRGKAIMASGAIGDIILVENAFTGKVDMSQRWNSNRAISGGGVMIDNGTHSVDIIRYLAGPVTSVMAVEGPKQQGLEVDEAVNMFLTLGSGASATVDLTWSLGKDLDWYFSIYGTGGTLRIGWRESKYKQSSSPEWTVFGKGYDKWQAFKSQVGNFVNHLLGVEDLLISKEDAIASVEVIQAAYESMATSRWVKVAPAPVAAPPAPAMAS